MARLILFLLGVVVASSGLVWLAGQPGTVRLELAERVIETSLFRAVVIASLIIGSAIMLWSIARQLWRSPASVGRFIHRRRQERGLDALSSGLIAIGAGDRALAMRHAVQARKALPNEPLTHLLRAQAAQLSGDRATSRRIFEAMLSTPDTEQAGLYGLFREAAHEKEWEAARQFASRALELNAKLPWAFDALFELQCKASDWAGALETLNSGRRQGLVEKADADRRRAVLLTAQAQGLEEENGQKALDLAAEAHNLAPDLAPAAVIAGRLLASRGNTARAAKVIEKTWKREPHPDLAVVYAFARPGDSPRDRLERVKRLARSTPGSAEGPVALAKAAIEAGNWDEARNALEPLIEGRLSQRVCTLMARIEQGEKDNAGGVREWLARAVNAPRDPAWTADGIVSETWAPISPVTGALDVFKWRVPVENGRGGTSAALGDIDDLIAIAGRSDGKAHAGAMVVPMPPRSLEDFIDAEDDDRPITPAPKSGSGYTQRPASGLDLRKRPVPSQAGAMPNSPAGLSEASIALEIEPIAVTVSAPPVPVTAGAVPNGAAEPSPAGRTATAIPVAPVAAASVHGQANGSSRVFDISRADHQESSGGVEPPAKVETGRKP